MTNIKNLANEWDRAFVALLKEEKYSISQVERLLNETYKLCTEYCTSDTVPKELCMVFSKIQWFLSTASDAYKIDSLTTSSDSADVDAIDIILDAIECGFYTGEYEYAYPQLSVTDNNQRAHVYDLNKSFLEDFIDALR